MASIAGVTSILKMLESLLEVFGAGLSIWNHKEKNKYADKKMALEKEWYAEYNKPDDVRSIAALDRIEHELRVLSRRFAAEVRASNPTSK